MPGKEKIVGNTINGQLRLQRIKSTVPKLTFCRLFFLKFSSPRKHISARWKLFHTHKCTYPISKLTNLIRSHPCQCVSKLAHITTNMILVLQTLFHLWFNSRTRDDFVYDGKFTEWINWYFAVRESCLETFRFLFFYLRCWILKTFIFFAML